MSYYAYLGPLGEVVRHRASFLASKDGFLIGTYDTFGEAMESLRGKDELKHFSSLNRGAVPIWSSWYRDAIWYENQPPIMNERSCDNEENARAWRIV